MHAHSAFFCVDMCVFAFCVCIRVHLCLDMCSVQAGDCVLCTIWSSGSTRLFCNDECVCYLLFFYYVHFVHSTLICAQSGAAVVAVRVQRARAGLEIPAKRRRAPLFH